MSNFNIDAKPVAAGYVLAQGANGRFKPVDPGTLTPAGHLTPAANNTYDLGITGTRWRTVYAGTSVNAPQLVMAPSAASSGVRSAISLTGAADTGLTAATEQTDVDLNLGRTVTWASGAGPLAAQRAIRVRAPTYAGNVAAALTITNASTLEIDNAPQAGSNVTLTNAWALRVVAGAVYFGGAVSMGSTLAVTTSIRTPLILDANGNESLGIAATANAVNYVQVSNAATLNGVAIAAAGDDTNVSFDMAPKGTGNLTLRAGDGNPRVQVNNTGLGFFGASPAAQPAAVADAAGGATVDAEARTAINDLLARLRTLGIIAT